MSTDRRLVLTAGSVETRRQLGPTAWVVFEELLLASIDTPDGCVVSVSIRALAVRLGVSKDTVARAIGRLRHAGLVTAHQSRRESGVFATGSYTLTIPPTVAVTDHIESASSTTTRSASQSTRPTRHRDQLALTLTT